MTRWATRTFGCAALVTASSFVQAAHAQQATPRGIELRWSAPAGCPEAAQLAAEVERLLGRSLPESAVSFTADATVERDDAGRWHMHLETRARDDARTRELDGESCDDVANATAVILALAIDEEQSTQRTRRVAPSPTTAPASERADAGAESVDRERWIWAARARGAVDVASLPQASAGFGADVELIRGALRIELGAMIWIPKSAAVADHAGAGGTVSLFTGALHGCFVPIRARAVELGACGGLEAGRIAAEGFGVTSPATNSGLWLAPGLGLLAVWRAGPRLGIVAEAEALAPLVRDEFTLLNVGDVHRAPPLTGRAAVGLEVRFR